MTNHSAAPAAPHSADALKPCPFCGDEMKIDPGAVGFATGPGEVYVICDCGAMGAGGKDQDEAIAAWNRRPTPASPGLDIEALRKAAEAATPGPWMRLFGERTVYDRMSDGCRGNAIVRADSVGESANLDFIARANPAVILALLDERRALLDRLERAEAAAGAVPEGWKALPPTLPNSLLRAACDGFRMALNEMTGKDAHVVRKTYAALFAAAPKAAPRRQAEAAPSEPVAVSESEQDLLDIVRSFCSTAKRLTELTPQQREHYPSPLSPMSPLLQAASAACVERGYTEWGLAIEGVKYPVATPPAQDAGTGATVWKELLEAVVREMPKRAGRNGNAPGHAHKVPGIWDSDNGALAGQPCAWCIAWNGALRAIANSGRTE